MVVMAQTYQYIRRHSELGNDSDGSVIARTVIVLLHAVKNVKQ